MFLNTLSDRLSNPNRKFNINPSSGIASSHGLNTATSGPNLPPNMATPPGPMNLPPSRPISPSGPTNLPPRPGFDPKQFGSQLKGSQLQDFQALGRNIGGDYNSFIRNIGGVENLYKRYGLPSTGFASSHGLTL